MRRAKLFRRPLAVPPIAPMTDAAITEAQRRWDETPPLTRGEAELYRRIVGDQGIRFAEPRRDPEPRLLVCRRKPGEWMWVIRTPLGNRVSAGRMHGYAPTQPAALALGMAALEAASVRRE